MIYSQCMEHSKNEILVAGSATWYQTSLSNSIIKFYPKNGTWSHLYTSANTKPIIGLFQLGQKIFVKQQYSIYQFDPSTNKFNDTRLTTKIKGHMLFLAVPAKVFSNLPGGCEGVEWKSKENFQKEKNVDHNIWL